MRDSTRVLAFKISKIFKNFYWNISSHLVSYVLGEDGPKYAKNSFTVKIW